MSLKSSIYKALRIWNDVDAVREGRGGRRVELDSGEVAVALADDLEPEQPVAPWVALLSALDPTARGWSERGFYVARTPRWCSTAPATPRRRCGPTGASSARGRSRPRATC